MDLANIITAGMTRPISTASCSGPDGRRGAWQVASCTASAHRSTRRGATRQGSSRPRRRPRPDTPFAAAGQRELERKDLERVQPLLEHREPRDERERDGGERHEAQHRGEGKAARGAAEPASGQSSDCSTGPGRSWASSHPGIPGREHTTRSFACTTCHPGGFSRQSCLKCHDSNNGGD